MAFKNNGSFHIDGGGDSTKHHFCAIQNDPKRGHGDSSFTHQTEYSNLVAGDGCAKVPDTKEAGEEEPRKKKCCTVEHDVASVIGELHHAQNDTFHITINYIYFM